MKVSDLDKEDREILWMVFLQECIEEVSYTKLTGTYYQDHGGTLIAQAHIGEYFQAWVRSLDSESAEQRINSYMEETLH